MQYVLVNEIRPLSWRAGLILSSKYLYRSRRSFAGMANRTYDDAVDALNTLQTSFRVLEERRKAGMRLDKSNIIDMRSLLNRIGHSAGDLDRLNIVHVAGTKGKGSTCAYVDSILSHYQKSHGIPAKTGLFTSPHLVSVRERIRINSVPISAPLFAKYFFEVWDLLESSAKSLSLDPRDKPTYFRCLTLMSFHVFLKEGINVAIYEVGVGGEYDSTNIIERPAAVGISKLGIDHVFILGNSVDKIAWHKAGIMKTGSPAFSVEQDPEAMKVVEQRAHEKKVDIKILEIDPILKSVNIRPDADFQRENASLAVSLSAAVLKRLDPAFSLPPDKLPKEFIDGLERVVWRGRFEIKTDRNVRWYLDGAHTVDSLRMAAQWFANQSSEIKGTRALIFNQQGRSEAVDLLAGLFTALKSQNSARFDHVVFCTNVTYAEEGYKRDFVNHTYDSAAIAGLTVQKKFAEKWKSLDPNATIIVTPSIEEALENIRRLADGEGKEVQALVTGSLHLVGGAIGVLEGAEVL